MIFDVITIFPDFFRSILEYGILRRALAAGQIEVRLHDLRDYTEDAHRTVDDRPFGGGAGMVFKPEPVFRAVEHAKSAAAPEIPVILLSPQGRLLEQAIAEELAKPARPPGAGPRQVVLICGRYEGVDNRVVEGLASDELSIGDYVLSGGELAAAVVIESCTRLLPGVMGNEASGSEESFSSGVSRSHETGGIGGNQRREPALPRGILGYPQYTRPAEFRGLRVPEVLLSGNHEQIRRWRRRQALQNTWRRRPELLENCALSTEDRDIVEELRRGSSSTGG
jgi:tRNA (guanine37-N1)-methyltransferase